MVVSPSVKARELESRVITSLEDEGVPLRSARDGERERAQYPYQTRR